MTNKLEISRELLSHAAALLSSVHSDVAHQLTALLAAPVVERQPAATVNRKAVCFLELTETGRSLPDGTKLYTSPPAQVAVVLPRDPEKAFFEWTDTLPSAPRCLQTWLAALDMLKELNQ